MKKFVFVRHGQSTANANKTIAVDDTPLTDLGIEQAKITAMEIAKLNIKTIVCSPLRRARQTAETIATALGINQGEIKIIDELRERGLGDLKGRKKQHDSNYYYVVNNEHNVEAHDITTARVKTALKKIETVARVDSVLVVGHAISGYFLLEVASGRKDYSEFEPPEEIMNANFIIVDLDRHNLKTIEE